ncbi:MAG: ATP synthase F1 subunit delta [Patescibacteria group bacterium]
MKVSLRKYAQVLASTLEEDKDSNSVNQKIQNLLKILTRRKQSKLIKNLPAAFQKIWLSQKGQMVVKLTLAKEASKTELEQISSLLKEAFKKEVILDVKVDPNVIGGMKIEFDDYIIDSTVLGNLESLKSQLTKV